MIQRLALYNFRSHRSYAVDFQPGMNIITGSNGCGKTTILEAIYIALTGKSWRSNFDEIIHRPITDVDNWWKIDLTVDSELRTVKYIHQQKEFIIEGKSFKRLSSQRKLPVVLFEPNDMQLLYGSPKRRRDFLDRMINVIIPNHQSDVNKFERVLRQRNNLIKQDEVRADELMVWNIQFAELSSRISERRSRFVSRLNRTLNDKYREIAGIDDAVKLQFINGAPVAQSAILRALTTARDSVTPVGAQKDDFKFIFNGKDSKLNASRGENRTTLFALLAVIVDTVRESLGQAYVLLDDVDSELDEAHRHNLYSTSSFTVDTIATTLTYSGSQCHHIEIG